MKRNFRKIGIIGILILSLLNGTLTFAETKSPDPDSSILQEGESRGASEGETSDLAELPELPSGEDIAELYYETRSGMGYEIFSSNKLTEKTCIMLLPDGTDIDAFMEQTEWKMFAEMDSYHIICLAADWENETDAREYYNEVLEQAASDLFCEEEQLFLLGYEDGADFAAALVCEDSEKYAGLVTFGGSGLTEEKLEKYESQEDISPVSVWMFVPEKTDQMKKTIKFWKNLDAITEYAEKSYELTYADELFMPRTSSADNIDLNDQYMGVLYITYSDEFMNFSVSANVSRHFISQITKTETAINDEIRGPEVYGTGDRHFTYYRTQFEGQQREYWLYVPDQAFLGEEASSLILCLHGSGGNGTDMVFRSNWQDTAAENNCIVVYPSSLYRNGFQHYWQNIDEEMDFLRGLIEMVCEKYSVDRSRIYVTGFSNGAGMAQNLAVNCSDIFAAAALSAPAYWDEEYFGAPEEIHEVAILFSYGSEDKYLKEYEMTAEIDDYPAISHLAYWRGMYGFQQNFYSCEQNGNIRIYTFRSKYNIPVCSWVIVEGKGHSYPKEEVPAFYAFLQNYTKGEDGTLYYNGEPVYSK